MRARTITILSLLICALAIPASASALYGSAPDSITGGPTDSNQPFAAPDHSALDASLNGLAADESKQTGLARRTPTELAMRTAPAVPGPGTGSLSTSNGFDWGDAALGAGAAMALVTLGGAALLAVRRRTTISPSASTS